MHSRLSLLLVVAKPYNERSFIKQMRLALPRQPLTEDELLAGRSRIVEATTRLIAADGIDSLSMRSVAKRVGLTAGALYRYFPNKQQLLVHCWADALEGLARRFDQIDADTGDPVEAVRTMLTAYARFGMEENDRFNVLFMPAHGDAAVADAGEPIPRAFQFAFMQVERAVVAGRFPGVTPAVALRILWGSVHGILALRDNDPSTDFEYTPELFSTAIDVVISGLSSRKAHP